MAKRRVEKEATKIFSSKTDPLVPMSMEDSNLNLTLPLSQTKVSKQTLKPISHEDGNIRQIIQHYKSKLQNLEQVHREETFKLSVKDVPRVNYFPTTELAKIKASLQQRQQQAEEGTGSIETESLFKVEKRLKRALKAADHGDLQALYRFFVDEHSFEEEVEEKHEEIKIEEKTISKKKEYRRKSSSLVYLHPPAIILYDQPKPEEAAPISYMYDENLTSQVDHLRSEEEAANLGVSGPWGYALDIGDDYASLDLSNLQDNMVDTEFEYAGKNVEMNIDIAESNNRDLSEPDHIILTPVLEPREHSIDITEAEENLPAMHETSATTGQHALVDDKATDEKASDDDAKDCLEEAVVVQASESATDDAIAIIDDSAAVLIEATETTVPINAFQHDSSAKLDEVIAPVSSSPSASVAMTTAEVAAAITPVTVGLSSPKPVDYDIQTALAGESMALGAATDVQAPANSDDFPVEENPVDYVSSLVEENPIDHVSLPEGESCFDHVSLSDEEKPVDQDAGMTQKLPIAESEQYQEALISPGQPQRNPSVPFKVDFSQLLKSVEPDIMEEQQLPVSSKAELNISSTEDVDNDEGGVKLTRPETPKVVPHDHVRATEVTTHPTGALIFLPPTPSLAKTYVKPSMTTRLSINTHHTGNKPPVKLNLDLNPKEKPHVDIVNQSLSKTPESLSFKRGSSQGSESSSLMSDGSFYSGRQDSLYTTDSMISCDSTCSECMREYALKHGTEYVPTSRTNKYKTPSSSCKHKATFDFADSSAKSTSRLPSSTKSARQPKSSRSLVNPKSSRSKSSKKSIKQQGSFRSASIKADSAAIIKLQESEESKADVGIEGSPKNDDSPPSHRGNVPTIIDMSTSLEDDDDDASQVSLGSSLENIPEGIFDHEETTTPSEDQEREVESAEQSLEYVHESQSLVLAEPLTQ
jgi:hypothetical protein